jgi:hypothetical protein
VGGLRAVTMEMSPKAKSETPFSMLLDILHADQDKLGEVEHMYKRALRG